MFNDDEMLAENIRELTKCEENITTHSENVLTWAKRVEAQRAQMVVNSCLHEANKLYCNHGKRYQAQRQKDP